MQWTQRRSDCIYLDRRVLLNITSILAKKPRFRNQNIRAVLEKFEKAFYPLPEGKEKDSSLQGQGS
jgi:hypothetical protein